MAMNAAQIQGVVLDALRAAGVSRVISTSVYSLSDEADNGEPGISRGNPEEYVARWDRRRHTANREDPAVLVEFIASRDEFQEFVRRANEGGVWVNFSWKPYGVVFWKFDYTVVATEKY